MTGAAGAALVLSAATLISASPRRRLEPAGARRRRSVRAVLVTAGRAAACGVAGLAGLAGVAGVLPTAPMLAAAVLATTAGLRHRRRARHRRGVTEAGALHTALDVLISELRAGVHPVRAFEVAASETDQPPVAVGLRTVAARARLGADVPAGLRGAAESSSLPAQWQRLAVYWQLGAEHGLAISTLMQAAQRDIAERQRFSARLHAGMAGARASAAILAGLPVLGVLLGQLIGAGPLTFLLGGDGAGGVLLVAGVLLVCAGLAWSDRITEKPA